MDLSNIKKIVDFTSFDNDNFSQSVNSYLADGWIMLYCGCEIGDDNTQYARIILGTEKI